MMQVKPHRRPSADEILKLKEVKDKIDELYLDDENNELSNTQDKPLLDTILLPEEIEEIMFQLPKPNYAGEDPEFMKEYLNSDIALPNFRVKPDTSLRSRKNSRQTQIMKEVFNYGVEKSKSKESNRNDIQNSKLSKLLQ